MPSFWKPLDRNTMKSISYVSLTESDYSSLREKYNGSIYTDSWREVRMFLNHRRASFMKITFQPIGIQLFIGQIQ